MSILLFLLVLFVLVLVHEFGHFIVAKITGMRVDEFGIGFPPRLLKYKRGETTYSLNIFPIGGFVKIFGEDGTSVASSPVSSESRDRRSEALAEADEGGEDGTGVGRLFVSKSKWSQVAVLLAGVTMNVVLAWFLFAFSFSLGVQTSVDESEATQNARLFVTSVVSGSPADTVSLPQGATIVHVQAGERVLESLTPSSFSSFISENPQEEIILSYQYKGELLLTSLTPKTGIIPSEPDRAAIGVALTLIDTISKPIHRALSDATTYTIDSLGAITVGIGGLIKDAFLFRADFSHVAGPVGIVGLVGEASSFGLTSLLMFTAFISLNLAVINLLPFPALDGGRILFVIIEAVKGSPINPRYANTLNFVGFAFLILLMVAVTWNDIARLI